MLSLNKWLFWLQKRDNLEAWPEMWGYVCPFPRHQANAPAFVWSVESRPPSLSPRLMTSVTPLCSLFLAELARSHQPLQSSACSQVISKRATQALPSCWSLRSSPNCVAAHHLSECPSPLPLPPRPLPCARSLALSLFMRCKARHGAEPWEQHVAGALLGARGEAATLHHPHPCTRRGLTLSLRASPSHAQRLSTPATSFQLRCPPPDR